MPALRKMEMAEIEKMAPKASNGERAAIARQYDELLADYAVGDFCEVTLEEGENRATVKSRFVSAATRKGWDLEFKRTKGDALRFKIVEPKSLEVGV
jgi:hypothetical protein